MTDTIQLKSIERGKQGDRTQLILISLHSKAMPDELKGDIFEMYCQNLSTIKVGDVNARTLRYSSGEPSHAVLPLHNIALYAKLAGTNPRIRETFIRYWDMIAQWLLLLYIDYEEAYRNMEEHGRRKTICWTIFKQIADNRIEEIWTRVRADRGVYELYWLLYKHCIEEPFEARVKAVLMEKCLEALEAGS